MSTLGKNYKQACADWFLEAAKTGQVGEAEKRGAELFAAYLDGFNVLTEQLQILALQQGRKVDGEVINALIDEIGVEKATKIVRGIVGKYTRK